MSSGTLYFRAVQVCFSFWQVIFLKIEWNRNQNIVSEFDWITKWNKWFDISSGVSHKAELNHFWTIISESTMCQLGDKHITLREDSVCIFFNFELFTKVLMRKLVTCIPVTSFDYLFAMDPRKCSLGIKRSKNVTSVSIYVFRHL